MQLSKHNTRQAKTNTLLILASLFCLAASILWACLPTLPATLFTLSALSLCAIPARHILTWNGSI